MENAMRIISGSANLPLAGRIAQYCGVSLTECEVSRFSDGEVKIQINENIRGSDLFIVQPTNPPAENLVELLISIDASRRASAKRITAVIPYYGYARQDRKDQPRVSIAAKLMANLITEAGANRIITMDLHASQLQGFFDLPHDHLYASKIFYEYFQAKGVQDIVAVSGDVGSIKVARAFAKKLRCGLAIIDKRRPEDNRAEVMNVIGDVKGKNVVVRDDLIDTGGTLVLGAEALKEQGALDIYACVTHGVLSGDAIRRIEESPITEIIITDTIDRNSVNLPPKFTVLSTAGIFGEAIRRIWHEESVSKLFD
ncbi:MAG: ribose-phosphate pyrophosphokinase [candidate division Zixibacteria bacterium]|nr:ribose-phosphate pyrophosphokinase [candidate division Zixibacteria bacterium]